MKRTSLLFLLCVAGLGIPCAAQASPPWSHGRNDPATQQGFVFQVDNVDNVPDLHGNPCNAKLVLFIGGNQFFALPQLVAVFEQEHPDLKGLIFYETLPPGILRKQMAAGNAVTLGNLTIQVKPDVYEAGARVLNTMQQAGQVTDVIPYVTNTLEIMVPKGNPKHIRSLNDLGRPGLRLSMPNPAWEGVANQIQSALRKAGGDALEKTVYETKVQSGETKLTQIHHRQTPMRILSGAVDAGVTWASEVRFQTSIGNPVEGVPIPDDQNETAIYAGGIVKDAPHAATATEWLAFLKSEKAQAIYHQYGFRSYQEAEQ